MTKENLDNAEIAKFDALADRWWDRQGEFRPLHDINPLRLSFIERQVSLPGMRVLDVGCGGGILTEGLAQRGAQVSGIDMAPAPLSVAKLHLLESNLKIDYQLSTAEAFAAQHAGEFDVVCCMEMLEHVPEPASVVEACARLLKPGGLLFLSTINRSPKAYLMAVIGAEYLLRLLPRGTHDYRKFIRPAELAGWGRDAGMTLAATAGLHYHPITRRYSLDNRLDVNYLVCLSKAENDTT